MVASTAPKSLLEMQIPGSHHRPTDQNPWQAPGVHVITNCPSDSCIPNVGEALVLVWTGVHF